MVNFNNSEIFKMNIHNKLKETLIFDDVVENYSSIKSENVVQKSDISVERSTIGDKNNEYYECLSNKINNKAANPHDKHVEKNKNYKFKHDCLRSYNLNYKKVDEKN